MEIRTRQELNTVISDVVRDIELYIENEGTVYVRSITPLIRNYARKMSKGKFDREKAIKGFIPVVVDGMKEYKKDFCSSDFPWYKLMTVPERKICAECLLDYFMEQIKWDADEIRRNK